jgi:transcription elongation factor/antiterminator RfaH
MFMNWYVIQTKPKKEEDAKSYLTMNGLEVFNPLMETFTQRNGAMGKELRSLFPNYIFGKFDIDQNYALVRWGRGVKKILGFGEYPAPVSDDVIEIIRNRVDSSGVVRKTVHFNPDDWIRIKSGPLKDLVGIFDRWVSENDRVRVLLNLIGYHPEVEIHYSMIEKVA